MRKFIASNQEVPAQLFGKWANAEPESTSQRGQWDVGYTMPTRVSDKTTKMANQYPEPENLSNELANKPTTPTKTTLANTTEKWVRALPVTRNSNKVSDTQSSSQAEQCRQTDTKKEPRASDFKVPIDQLDYETMINKLVAGGSLESEAEQIIANRRLLFNRAMREFKKLNNNKPQKSTNKKQGKQSKHQQDTTI